MGDFFGGLRSGIQFPQVVMNQGPLPGSGGLPTPLHEGPDARINYNSSLLGDLTPYAYGEPGYLSSQNAYLNIPHKIQKIVPVVYLPEAKIPAQDIIDLSHPIDDGDIAFVLRLDRSSMFCTGLRNGSMRRAGLGTAIDPFVNLCTLNYILSGAQLAVNNEAQNLWTELLSNLDKDRFGRQGGAGRDYADGQDPINLGDVIHLIRHCIRPFGVTRGSEKQGGQDEATMSPATWPVSFVVSLTIDGKESNVLNIWHNHNMSAGDDLVLRLKPMPIKPYTLNHYYKGVKRQAWDKVVDVTHVWQLVPDLMSISSLTGKEKEAWTAGLAGMPRSLSNLRYKYNYNPRKDPHSCKSRPPPPPLLIRPDFFSRWAVEIDEHVAWQELGYWHIGRSQVLTRKYGEEEYWHNDLANSLRTNHLDITFQPMFQSLPLLRVRRRATQRLLPVNMQAPLTRKAAEGLVLERLVQQPVLAGSRWKQGRESRRLEQEALMERRSVAEAVRLEAEVPANDEPDWLGRLEFADEPAAVEPVLKKAKGGKRAASRQIGGSLLRVDGSSEPSEVNML